MNLHASCVVLRLGTRLKDLTLRLGIQSYTLLIRSEQSVHQVLCSIGVKLFVPIFLTRTGANNAHGLLESATAKSNIMYQ